MNAPGAAAAPPGPVDGAGEVVAGRYRLEQPLARGAMGSIWRASHVELKKKVAIKFLNSVGLNETELHGRFLQEARAAAAVGCAHVVQVFDYGRSGAIPFIVMELLEGETLEQRLARCRVLTWMELDKVFREVAAGVSRAHAMGVVHRDLKPSNIFIAREGATEVTKLIDFGIAKVDEAQLGFTPRMGTRAGTVIGTPQYMSPEQLRSGADTDHGVDLWALGVIAFECLTGRLPFSGKTLTDIAVQICTETPLVASTLADVPPGFDAWFAKATDKDAGRRFASAEEMAEALSLVLASVRQTSVSSALALPAREPTRVRGLLSRISAAARVRLRAGLGWTLTRGWLELPAWRPSALPISGRGGLLAAALACLAVGVSLSVRAPEAGSEAAPRAGQAEGSHGEGSTPVRQQVAAGGAVPNQLAKGDDAAAGASGAPQNAGAPNAAALSTRTALGAPDTGSAVASGVTEGSVVSRADDAAHAAKRSAPIASAERSRPSSTEQRASANAQRPAAASAARVPSPRAAIVAAIPPVPGKEARERGVAVGAAPAPVRATQSTEPSPKRPSAKDAEALFAERL